MSQKCCPQVEALFINVKVAVMETRIVSEYGFFVPSRK